VVDGALYCNDGDWVENCTALAETAAGELELLHWPRLRERLARPDAANDHRAEIAPRLPARATARR